MMLAWSGGTQSVLGDVDVAFAQLLARRWPGTGDDAQRAAALASWAVQQGHTCFDFAQLARDETLAAALATDQRLAGLDAVVLANAARGAPFVALPESAREETPPHSVLALEGMRLYLRRYREYERELAALVLARAEAVDAAPDGKQLTAQLQALFPNASRDALAAAVAIACGRAPRSDADPQALACALAASHRLTVLCGGPGTGKTFTVVRLLALLAMQERATPLRIALAAPTGKAATRLSASLQAGLPALALASSVRERLQLAATTVHRLLRLGPTQVAARFDRERPLALDVLVVDECSMLDLPLFTKLLRAVPAHARLVLVGDPEQLPAVEGGAVLTALAETALAPRGPVRVEVPRVGPAQGTLDFGATAAASPAPATAAVGSSLAQRVVRLSHAHRFGAGSAIARLVDAVRRGDAREVRALLAAGHSGLAWHDATPSGTRAAFASVVREGYGALRERPQPEAALAALEAFRVLCALRDGATGVAGLNGTIESALDLRHAAVGLHAGEPVLVLANDHDLGLYNGDTGVALTDGDGSARVWFRDATGTLRAIAPGQLPAHETGYAMTVHKAQGSEFDEVVLVLPREPHALLTREWLYTAVSRARSRLTVFAPFVVVEQALARRQRVMSGLPERLSAPP